MFLKVKRGFMKVLRKSITVMKGERKHGMYALDGVVWVYVYH